jgi:hypothetical protein
MYQLSRVGATFPIKVSGISGECEQCNAAFAAIGLRSRIGCSICIQVVAKIRSCPRSCTIPREIRLHSYTLSDPAHHPLTIPHFSHPPYPNGTPKRETLPLSPDHFEPISGKLRCIIVTTVLIRTAPWPTHPTPPPSQPLGKKLARPGLRPPQNCTTKVA